MDRILLVDDNPLRAAMRLSVLEGSGPKVMRALDPAEALCMVENSEFTQGLALVISGHLMSGISGPEFAAEFRSRLPHVPVLVLSSTKGVADEYADLPGVYYSETKSPDELRGLVKRLTTAQEMRTA